MLCTNVTITNKIIFLLVSPTSFNKVTFLANCLLRPLTIVAVAWRDLNIFYYFDHINGRKFFVGDFCTHKRKSFGVFRIITIFAQKMIAIVAWKYFMLWLFIRERTSSIKRTFIIIYIYIYKTVIKLILYYYYNLCYVNLITIGIKGSVWSKIKSISNV